MKSYIYKIKEAYVAKNGKIKYKTIGYSTDLRKINLKRSYPHMQEDYKKVKDGVPHLKAKEIRFLQEANAGYKCYSALSNFEKDEQ